MQLNNFNSLRCINLRKFPLNNSIILKKRSFPLNPICTTTNFIHHNAPEAESKKELPKAKFVTFNSMVTTRRDEAERSILVQVQSAKSAKELHSYCSSMGNVKYMFHYSHGMEALHFILVEFENTSDVQKVLSASSYLDSSQVVPVHSQFLWFRAVPKKERHKIKTVKKVLDAENATTVMKNEDINLELSRCDDISSQMKKLYELTKLNDLGSRLRFLTAKQIEASLSGMFPHAKVFPFGSSVNGFGKMGCDLDLVLRLNDVQVDESRRLVFHGKASPGTERSTSQRNLESIGDLIQLFLPGCAQVRRILQARVPIVKYNQQLTGIECDLSMTNMSGYHMSDFLYIMGSFDERVRPLVYAIRRWASEVGLTNPSPGRWITNFSLTLLVLAFLQRPLNSPPILPSLNALIKAARPHDKYITEDGINCTFLRDIKSFQHRTKNEESLEELLREFFEFYAQFDFSSKALSLNEAVSFPKPEHSPMYIVNPLERGLNVSKNVSLEEVERFKMEVRNAAWILESQENKNEQWGLLSIFNNKRKLDAINFYTSKHERLMEVSTLFEEEEEEKDTVFKNEQVKKQIEDIKNETREKVKGIAINAKLQKSNR